MTAMSIDGLRWEVRAAGPAGDAAGMPAVLFLHGFTGRGTSWGAYPAACRCLGFGTVVVDLPGHGRSGIAGPGRLGIERTADDLAVILGRLGTVPASVVGYSLGARIALRLAVAHPRVVARLVLESPSAGIADDAGRAARRAADEEVASAIERDGTAAFVERWERNPVFAGHAGLDPRTLVRQRAIRLANRPDGLAASLRDAGQGAMEPLHDRLGRVAAPTLVIVGDLDPARPRAEVVAAGIPGARLAVVDGAGHTPHLERPAAFRRLALGFLQEDAA